ncbi:MAG: hypothetical protein CUN55_13745, partial [Phototrophicales bacterium]
GSVIEGAIGSSIITGVLGILTVEDADPILSIIIGALLGAIIGLLIVVLAIFMPTQRWFPFPLVGGVIGAFLFGVATVFGIQLGEIINSSLVSVIVGFMVGAVIGGVVMRQKRSQYQRTMQQ